MFISLSDTNNQKALSVILTDYYKCVFLLFDLKLIGSKLITEDELPEVLNPIKSSLTSKELFEINALVDFCKFYTSFVQKISRLESLEKIKALLPSSDFVLFADQNKRAYKIIFEKYPSVANLYYDTLRLRSTMLELDGVLESINLKENLNNFIKHVDSFDYENFLVDFEKMSTESFRKKLTVLLLENIKEESCNFATFNSGGICNLEGGYLSLINYIERASAPTSSLSLISHYIYYLKYKDEVENTDIRGAKETRKLENRANLDKMFFVNNSANLRLNDFLEEVATQDFSNKLIIEKGNEVLNILVKNNSFFEDDENNNVFAIYMLYKIREKVAVLREEIREEIANIIKKPIRLEYRLVELELYIKKTIQEFMHHKKVVSNKNELENVFYNGVKKIFEEEISTTFSSLIETTKGEQE